ncbi:disease resistance protein RPM1-like [Telopea speciosissima]|uniref:disease resistance protein RPM1-like n=1 Tax=Telopea speciosissima TaxID=54955 RepID=UPI001CC3AD99|nr:disease resistance protein RPM1-like [Telopea speciosissima]
MALPVVSFLLSNLGSLLVAEAKLLKGVRTDIRDLVDELESIQPFLKDADARGETDEGVKIWGKQVRDVAYEIEDAIDEFMLRIHQQQKPGFIGHLHKIVRVSMELKSRHKIATDVQEIKRRITNIKERSQRYCFNSSDHQGSSSSSGTRRAETSSSSSWHDPRISSLYLEDSCIVGIDKPRDHLIQLLVQEEYSRSCTVISVAGMGGLGKTTLVKKVYDVPKVQEHFECHAWITVSQSFKPQNLLKSMMKQFYQEDEVVLRGLDSMEEVQLVNKLREYLQQKRYVIVLDDVWTIESWNSIQHALPNNDCGSRVVITTRSNEIASYCKKSNSSHVYNLKPLPDKEAWRLFCKTTFSLSQNVCPSDLEDLSLKILKRCEGLPLAIVATGALLSLKEKTRFEWQKLLDNLGSEFENNQILTRMTKILLLSFNDLPYYLKFCFLYFGIFPENYSIKCVRLFRLWTAEGFVGRQKGLTLEEVAEDYLKELVCRKLVQIEETYLDGRIRSCLEYMIFYAKSFFSNRMNGTLIKL